MTQPDYSSRSITWADENNKKVYPCTKNVVTEKVWIDWNIVHGIIFKGRTAVDDVGKPSSRLPRDLVTRWRWSGGCYHFLSFVFGVAACFVFNFVLWVNSDDITRWQSRHVGWFQIPYLGSCPLSIDQKRSLISSAKCLASLTREPIFFQIHTDSLEFGFKLIVFLFLGERYANFIHRQGASNYKAHG